MFALLAAIIAGISVVTSRIINGNLAKRIGILEGTLFNYITGLFFSLVALAISEQGLKFSQAEFSAVPWSAYLGGPVGVLVVSLSSYVAPRISSFYLTLFIFVGQLVTSMLIDYFALGLFSVGKMIGCSLVLGGLIYNMQLDKKTQCI